MQRGKITRSARTPSIVVLPTLAYITRCAVSPACLTSQDLMPLVIIYHHRVCLRALRVPSRDLHAASLFFSPTLHLLTPSLLLLANTADATFLKRVDWCPLARNGIPSRHILVRIPMRFSTCPHSVFEGSSAYDAWLHSWSMYGCLVCHTRVSSIVNILCACLRLSLLYQPEPHRNIVAILHGEYLSNLW